MNHNITPRVRSGPSARSVVAITPAGVIVAGEA
jgi:hypothetical protein